MKRRKVRNLRFRNLTACRQHPAPEIAVELMPLAELCGRLEDRQHRLLLHGLARLGRLIRSAAVRSDDDQPHMVKLRKTFTVLQGKLSEHLREESDVLYPLIRRLNAGEVKTSRERRRLQKSIVHLEQQHLETDDAIAELSVLAGGDSAPELRENICSLLQSLHEQIFEENRVLFPRALAASRA